MVSTSISSIFSRIALGGVLSGEVADTGDLVLGEPVIAWHPGIFAEACDPVAVLAAGDADPGDEARDRDVGLARPGADEIDKLVARIPQDFFFSSVWASMSSATTSFLRVSLASSCSIFLSLASSTALALRPWPYGRCRRRHGRSRRNP